MKKLKFNKRFIFGSVLLMLGSLMALGCNKVAPDPDPEPIDFIIPNYLVNGTYDASDTDFDYYEIEGTDDEYAIAIKDKSQTGSVQIPVSYNGHNITAIWHNGFHNSSLTSVTFPDDSKVETIDFEAFLYSKITSISIPYTVSEIGDAAFYACPDLVTVNFINSNQTSTGSATQCSCEDTYSRHATFNDFPETGAADVTYVALDTGKQYYWDVDEEEYVEIVVQNSTLETIPSFCFFKCNSLVNLSLPSHIKEIAEEAFNGCYSLSSAIFFQNIKTIRKRAFQGCMALTKVYISKSMFDNLNTENEGTIEPHAFNYCSNILEIIFCGTSEKVSAWLVNHQNWGWNTDYGNSATDKYTYRLESGDTYFTAEWEFTAQTINGVQHVTITKYKGSAPTAGTGWFISVPNKMSSLVGENKVVRIDKDAFNDVKTSIKRLYLPTTLMAIENTMFKSGFSQLYVVADNTQCAIDDGLYDTGHEEDIEGRIDLSNLSSLEFIGVHAFAGSGAGLGGKAYIKKLRLPAYLRAIGDEAFGIFNQRMLPAVDEFTWDYEDDSILETIGTDCFYALGITDGAGKDIEKNENWKPHTASTIVFPKTFKYFGMRKVDAQRYDNQAVNHFRFAILEGEQATKADRPAHAFAGCSLLGTVIFKGGSEGETTDLIIPVQTFVFNESLQTIVFEERENHYITFHTQIGKYNNNEKYSDYAQEAIGGNAGRGKNDFRSEPFLQTLVLPNESTKLRFQSFALHGNSRAAIYLSGNKTSNIYSDAKNYMWTELDFDADDTDMSRAKQWKTIGNESFYTPKQGGKYAKYYGYCFAKSAATNSSSDNSLNTFSLNQENPVYDNVHYEKTINGVHVEVGTSGAGKKEYKEVEKCSYVLEEPTAGNYEATMTNYLYNLHDGSTAAQLAVARVKDIINYDGHNYTVKTIGDSAFSACYNDETDTYNAVGDLTKIELPDSIVTIGEYAFIRAYGVTNIASYTSGTAPATDYRMPANLRHIGKNAFIFCGVQQILKLHEDCLFYENENDTHNITSVFANALSLRKVTFTTNGSDEVYSGKHYETTIYSHTGGGTYTSAIYSTDNSDLTYNKDRLLVILNRDPADFSAESGNSAGTKKDATVVKVDSNPVGVEYDGKYKETEYLFGAFKMAIWIKKMKCGVATTSDGTTVLNQPLFSPVGKIASNKLVDKLLYLGDNGILFEDLTCRLETVTGNALKLPGYALKGCEQLKYVELPAETNGEIPVGVFSDVNNNDTKYYIEGETPTAHVVDLTNSGYKKVGADAFKNNPSVQQFIAPSVTNFTVGSSAFEGCTNLTTLDFSNVTGSLTIEAGAFKSSGITSITWPNAPVTVSISGGDNNGAFQSCPLTSVQLPANLTSLGTCTFMKCTNLGTVSTVNDANIASVTTIGTKAFAECGNLNSFCFDKFTGLTTIGNQAFQKAGKLESSGDLSLPSTITSIGSNAFNQSKIVTLTINSSSISLGEAAFSSCASLTNVWFTVSNCSWSGYNKNVFSSCPNLVELQLPTGFDLNNNSYSSNYLVQSDSNLVFYTYTKYTTGMNTKDGWRKHTSGVYCDLCFLVENLNDLTNGGVIDGSTVNNNSTMFWTKDGSGHAINLGTVVSSTGTVVTFSSGYTLDSSGFHAPA